MKKEFWLDRWQNKQIGFHQDQVNPFLIKHWQQINCASQGRVFVPLCGKSADLAWLQQQGYDVLGIELSQLAVEAFFKEQALDYKVHIADQIRIYEAQDITIFQCDFFDLKSEHLGPITAVFDRAAMIALPEEMRNDYCQHLKTLAPDVEILLISMEYDQQLMQGPPFSVTENEIIKYYSTSHRLQLIEMADILKLSPKFEQQGLDKLDEKIYKLSPQRNTTTNG